MGYSKLSFQQEFVSLNRQLLYPSGETHHEQAAQQLSLLDSISYLKGTSSLHSHAGCVGQLSTLGARTKI
jgi:hypothetical protein